MGLLPVTLLVFLIRVGSRAHPTVTVIGEIMRNRIRGVSRTVGTPVPTRIMHTNNGTGNSPDNARTPREHARVRVRSPIPARTMPDTSVRTPTPAKSMT